MLEKAITKLNLIFDKLITMLPNMGIALLVLLAFFILAKIAKNASKKAFSRSVKNKILENLLSSIVYTTVFFIGVFYALGILDLDKTVTSLLAGAGVLGLGISLAFKETISNFIAGFVLAIRQPFKQGDIIEVKGINGTVNEITLRETKINNFDGQEVIIPNNEVLNNPIKNFSSVGRRKITLKVGVSYDEKLEEVKRIARESLMSLSFLKEGDLTIHFDTFDSSSINFTIRMWIDFPNGEIGYLDAVEKIIFTIKSAFDQNNINIPYPIRTIEVNDLEKYLTKNT